MRKRAIFWIGDEGEQESLPFLTALFPSLANQELREQVLFAVSETDAAGATEWLLERARDEAELVDVRKRALFWAADVGLSVGELRGLYEGLDEPELREHAIWLIAEHGGADSLDTLLEIARSDPNAEMRRRRYSGSATRRTRAPPKA